MIESDLHLPIYMFIFCMEIKCYNKSTSREGLGAGFLNTN